MRASAQVKNSTQNPYGIDKYTKLLLHMEGTNSGTVFRDETGKTVTRAGSAITSTTRKRFGSTSIYLAADADYIYLDGSSDFAFGTSDFTVDFWFYPITSVATKRIYDSRPAATNGWYVTILTDAGGHLIFITNAIDRITSTTVLSTAGVWYHCALTKTGGYTKLFLNGIQEGSSYADSNTYINPANRPAIGTDGSSLGSNTQRGYYDEIRVSNGIARWTSNFIPPSRQYGGYAVKDGELV